MNSSIFREKSIKKVSTPEELDDYLRVTGPSVWMILAAVVILLAGLFAVLGMKDIETTLKVGGVCENGLMTLYVKEADVSSLKPGMKVIIEDNEYEISEISDVSTAAAADIDAGALHVSGIGHGEWMNTVYVNCNLEDGLYRASIVVEKMKPMMFMISGGEDEQ